MEEIFLSIQEFLTPVLATTLTGLGTYLLAKVHGTAAKAIFKKAQDAVSVAVKQVYQTYVSELKEANTDGKLTPEEKKNARDQAVAIAKSYIGMKGLKVILWIFGLSDEKLVSLIEAEVYQAKQDGLWAKK